jgi:hypothetical protein
MQFPQVFLNAPPFKAGRFTTSFNFFEHFSLLFDTPDATAKF